MSELGLRSMRCCRRHPAGPRERRGKHDNLGGATAIVSDIRSEESDVSMSPLFYLTPWLPALERTQGVAPMIITPAVRDAGRATFACPSLEGVLLENQGGEGTAGNHWEARPRRSTCSAAAA